MKEHLISWEKKMYNAGRYVLFTITHTLVKLKKSKVSHAWKFGHGEERERDLPLLYDSCPVLWTSFDRIGLPPLRTHPIIIMRLSKESQINWSKLRASACGTSCCAVIFCPLDSLINPKPVCVLSTSCSSSNSMTGSLFWGGWKQSERVSAMPL